MSFATERFKQPGAMTKNLTATRCPHPRCTKRKPRSRYACYEHWIELPLAIRDAVWKGYEAGLDATWVQADKDARAFWVRSKLP